jgi:hypothetical protein
LVRDLSALQTESFLATPPVRLVNALQLMILTEREPQQSTFVRYLSHN